MKLFSLLKNIALDAVVDDGGKLMVALDVPEFVKQIADGGPYNINPTEDQWKLPLTEEQGQILYTLLTTLWNTYDESGNVQIKGIKLVRVVAGMSLADAKNVVDTFVRLYEGKN